jgi:hypothetical protein
MHPSAIVWLCVPLFYQRDVEHRVCQEQTAGPEFFESLVQVVTAMEFGS